MLSANATIFADGILELSSGRLMMTNGTTFTKPEERKLRSVERRSLEEVMAEGMERVSTLMQCVEHAQETGLFGRESEVTFCRCIMRSGYVSACCSAEIAADCSFANLNRYLGAVKHYVDLYDPRLSTLSQVMNTLSKHPLWVAFENSIMNTPAMSCIISRRACDTIV